jgi:hypothetical protein
VLPVPYQRDDSGVPLALSKLQRSSTIIRMSTLQRDRIDAKTFEGSFEAYYTQGNVFQKRNEILG